MPIEITPHSGSYQVEYTSPGQSVYQLCEKFPEQALPVGVMVIELDEYGKPEFAYFWCPCGKHESCQWRPVKLNLDPELSQNDPEIPCWTFTDHNGIAEISPSVWRTGLEGCHFFIRPEGVYWC